MWGWIIWLYVAISLVVIAYMGYKPFKEISLASKPFLPHTSVVNQEIKTQATRQTNSTRTRATNTRITRRTYSPSGTILGETIIESTTDTRITKTDNIASSAVSITQEKIITSGDSGLGAGVVINGNGIGLGVSKEVVKMPLDTSISVGAGVTVNPLTRATAPSLNIGIQAKPLPNLSATLGPAITPNTSLGYNIGPIGITPQLSVEYKF